MSDGVGTDTQNQDPSPERPLITLAIFSYNQEDYIAEAIEGALAQTYSPLEIIISDDCSTDRTFDIAQEVLRNRTIPHSIRLRKNGQNMGLCGHVNKVFEIAQGRLIVMNGGDDVSLPERVEAMYDGWVANGQPGAIQCSWIDIDESGSLIEIARRKPLLPDCGIIKWSDEGFLDQVESHLFIGFAGAALTYDKEAVFTNFPPMDPASLNEDGVLPFRACLGNGVMYVDRPLVKYRRHSSNMANSLGESNRSDRKDRLFRLRIERLQNHLKDLDFYIGRGADFDELMNVRSFLQRSIFKLEMRRYYREESNLLRKITSLTHVIRKGDLRDLMRALKSFFRSRN